MRAAIADLEVQSVDGVIVIAPSSAAVQSLGELPAGVSVVALEAEFRPDVPTVGVDQHHGGRLATQLLLDLGHGTVWHLAGPADWREAELRADGWRATLSAAGAWTPPVLRGDWTARSGYALARELVEQPDVTAIFAANDHMALGALHALRELGIAVPDQVSLVGFDDIPGAEYFTPGLTTIRQDFDEVGRRGLGLLMDQIDSDRPGSETPVLITPELVRRPSAAPPGR